MTEERVVQWHRAEGGMKPALAVRSKRGGLTLVYNDDCKVVARKVNGREERNFSPLDMTAQKFKKSMRGVGRRNAITKAAKKLLRG